MAVYTLSACKHLVVQHLFPSSRTGHCSTTFRANTLQLRASVSHETAHSSLPQPGQWWR
jgi:hypothetical protein